MWQRGDALGNSNAVDIPSAALGCNAEPPCLKNITANLDLWGTLRPYLPHLVADPIIHHDTKVHQTFQAEFQCSLLKVGFNSVMVGDGACVLDWKCHSQWRSCWRTKTLGS